MSAKNPKPAGEEKEFRPESQADRWLKYGSNVLLSIVLVIALAVMIAWGAQKADVRKDFTLGGSLSLKPQTVNVIRDLGTQHVTLVSLYTRPDDRPDEVAQAQKVSDLLDEYHDHSKNIDVKVIDPAKEKDKLESLHQEFITRYGSQIKNYKDYLEDWKKAVEQLQKLIDAEAKAIAPFGSPDEPGAADETGISDFVRTITDAIPDRLATGKVEVDRELNRKHPDYKAAVETVKDRLTMMSKIATAISEQTPQWIASPRMPDGFKKYLVSALPRYQEIKKIADDMVSRGAKLGELKIDQLEQALNVEDPILVLGENEWRILSRSQVWQDDTDVRALNSGAKPNPRFAGEQQISTAIYSLEHATKPKVCFVRGGGQPLTTQGSFFSRGGPFSFVAERLRQYNFDVSEKDLSGQWAMQAQMQQMPTLPEPSDEQIKDAIWIVIDVPMGEQQFQMPSQIGPKLKEHLAHGGSAMILASPRADNLADVLKDWGVDLHCDAIAVHEPIKLTDAADADPYETAKAQPQIFDVRHYGDHLIVKPIQNLDTAIMQSCVVRTHDSPGCIVTPILPLTENMPGVPTWGETDIEGMQNGPPQFNPDKGDLASPIIGGAIVEKKDSGRLVVLGSIYAATNGFMRLYDPKLAQRDPPMLVNRFPGNVELATNSVFWLAHLEDMIAISPSAMDVSRLPDMSSAAVSGWHLFAVLVMPLAVLAGGAAVYFARRD